MLISIFCIFVYFVKRYFTGYINILFLSNFHPFNILRHLLMIFDWLIVIKCLFKKFSACLLDLSELSNGTIWHCTIVKIFLLFLVIHSFILVWAYGILLHSVTLIVFVFIFCFWCSDCPRLCQWECQCLCHFEKSLHSEYFITFCPRRCFWLTLYFPCPHPGLSPSSNEP